METAWDFFSRPSNLSKITPEDMNFQVTSVEEVGKKSMYPGMIITYTVKPFPFIKMSWVTEITHVREPEYFIDEQRFGPFAFWHHEHKFIPVDGGVLMHDTLHYSVGWSIIGNVANNMLVEQRIMDIFKFRTKKITEIFGSIGSSGPII
ncbi:MAG: hypothetical protein EOO89_24130 [Pedobacter sp.]|nr:MAG: hypothetical protein EOO89_24130 [Pedobacter sp.]